MPEPGGPTLWAGAEFQAKVAAFEIAHLLSTQLQHDPSPIIEVRFEAAVDVDDILVVRPNVRTFQTVKTRFSYAKDPSAAWVKGWKRIHLQWQAHDFDRESDRIVLVVPYLDDQLGKLRELGERARAAGPNVSSWPVYLRTMFERIKTALTAQEEQVLELLRSFDVTAHGGDHDLLEKTLLHLSVAWPDARATQLSALDALVAHLLESGHKRPVITFATTQQLLETRAIYLLRPGVQPLVVVRAAHADPSPAEVVRFLRGSPASWAVIAGGIPVQRTCYIRERDELLAEAERTRSTAGLRLTAVIGASGTGKTTLGRRMALDLALRRCRCPPSGALPMRDRRHDVDSLPRVGAYVTVVLIAPRASPDMLRVVAILALGTAVYGAALALVQTSARRACGYLFLSQSALVMAWLDCTSVSALAGGLLLWLSAGIAFAGLARCVLVLEARRGRLDDEGAHLGIVVRPENAKHPSLFNNSPHTPSRERLVPPAIARRL